MPRRFRDPRRNLWPLVIGQSVSLLERLAGLMAEALLKEFPVAEVTLRVRKLSAVGVQGIPSVRIRRGR